MPRFFNLLGAFLYLVCLQANGATGDIVFSARYYYLPSSHKRSHFHLYRINPDGSGKRQLTFGKADDLAPLWSPDGARITFVRYLTTPKGTKQVLCVIKAGGGAVVPVLPIPPTMLLRKGDYSWAQNGLTLLVWGKPISLSGRTGNLKLKHKIGARLPSPDGRYLYLSSGPFSSEPDTIMEVRSGASVRTQVPLQGAIWWDSKTILGVIYGQTGPPHLCAMGVDGKVIFNRLVYQKVALGEEGMAPNREDLESTGPCTSLQKRPHDQEHVVIWIDKSNSTVRPLYSFYLVTISTGQAMRIRFSGQFLTWSPNGRYFCTADRQLQPYGTHSDGTKRVVWGTPLMLGDMQTHQDMSLTKGLVWVEGADWR